MLEALNGLHSQTQAWLELAGIKYKPLDFALEGVTEAQLQAAVGWYQNFLANECMEMRRAYGIHTPERWKSFEHIPGLQEHKRLNRAKDAMRKAWRTRPKFGEKNVQQDKNQ